MSDSIKEDMMKTKNLLSRYVTITALCCSLMMGSAFADAPDLVPDEPGTSPHYLCTWYAQNYWVKRGEKITSLEGINNPAAREELTYDHIFNKKEGWAATYLPWGRSDYFFLIDHGWQTKKASEREFGQSFFSLQIDPRDFPPYANLEPQESLLRFNEEIKALGWRGLGIWVRGTVSKEDAERLVMWQRIAPAFPAGVGSYAATDYDLVDRYPYNEHDTWYKKAYGKMVYQSAPAIMARNMPLPKVESDGDPPYVMASIYPNGSVCVATEGRVKPEEQWYHPRAKVTIEVKDATQPIGVFGHYDSLTLEFPQKLKDVKHVWAQDLLADKAIDIKRKVKIRGNKLTLPGKLIDDIGTSAGSEGDISAPGLMMKLEFEK